MKEAPHISTNPFENDLESNKKYVNSARRREEDQQHADESYSKFEEGSRISTQQSVYRKQQHQQQPQPTPKTQAHSTGLFGGRPTGPTRSKSSIKSRNPVRLTTERGNRAKASFSAIVARWSWMLTIFCCCCCKTSLVWAAVNILLSLAGTYMHNKGNTSAGAALGLISLISAAVQLFVMGFAASDVALQFFKLN